MSNSNGTVGSIHMLSSCTTSLHGFDAKIFFVYVDFNLNRCKNQQNSFIKKAIMMTSSDNIYLTISSNFYVKQNIECCSIYQCHEVIKKKSINNFMPVPKGA